ncbi:MAG: NAD(P)-dependent oxidoreductase [Phenylobacterium sp.]
MTDQPVVLVTQPRLVKMLAGHPQVRDWRLVTPDDIGESDRAQVKATFGLGGTAQSPEFLGTLPNLGLVACVSAGYDGVDVDWCRARGIAVTNAQGVNADEVADHAMAMLLGGWRNVVEGDRNLRAGKWSSGLPIRPRLRGRKAGIVGLGFIGAAIAERCGPFGLEVRWWGPNPKPDAKWPRAESLPALAGWCDILVIAAATHAGNRGMIDRAVIDAVGPEGMIVNIGRGAIIDEDALIAALRERRLGRAALDVFQQEPTPLERWEGVPGAVVLTPHNAGGSVESHRDMIGQAIENIRRFLAGEPLLSPL